MLVCEGHTNGGIPQVSPWEKEASMTLYVGPFVSINCTVFIASTPSHIVEIDELLELPHPTSINQSNQGRAASRETNETNFPGICLQWMDQDLV